MNSLFQFEIPKRQLVCSHHGERLQAEEEIYSLLQQEDPKQFTRQDFCSNCWLQVEPTLHHQPKRIYWKTKIEKKPVVAASTRVERALNLLRELIKTSAQSEAEIFVLGLFLSHARQLILRQEIQEDLAVYHVYEVAKQEEYFTIKVLNLSTVQISELQQLLAAKLNVTVS